MHGFLLLKGWHGTLSVRVNIVGETSKKYRIKALTKTKLAGRGRWLEEGQEALVPKTAILVEPPKEEDS